MVPLMEDLKEINELIRLSRKVAKYKFNIGVSYSFLIYGSSFASFSIIALSIKTTSYLMFLIVLISTIVLAGIFAVYLINRLFSAGFRVLTIEIESQIKIKRGFMSFLYFIIPPAIVYFILGILALNDWLPYAIAWYPSLGVSLILGDLTQFKKLYEKGYLVSRPFLESGVSILISFIILYFLLSLDIIIRDLFPIALSGACLLVYMITAIRTTILAEKIFEE